MKKMKKICSLLLAVILILSIVPEPVKAGTTISKDAVTEYGFKVSDEYNYEIIKQGMELFQDSKKIIGIMYYWVIRARSKQTFLDTDGVRKYYETLLVKTQMAPDFCVEKGTTYIGMNEYNQAVLTLNGNRGYVDMAPEGTMPNSQTTVSFGAGADLGGSDKFKFSVNTGWSSTIQDNCVKTHSSFYKSKELNAEYIYSVHNDFLTSKAKRAANQWLTNKHNCFYAYMYTTPVTYYNTPTSYNGYGYPMTLKINFSFRMASVGGKTTPSQWDGGTWDVLNAAKKSSMSITVR